MGTEIPLKETTGYLLAYQFMPFINPKMSQTDALLTIEDFGKSINSAFMNDKSRRISKLTNLVNKICQFSKGEKTTLDGLTYQKGINENSFYKEVERIIGQTQNP